MNEFYQISGSMVFKDNDLMFEGIYGHQVIAFVLCEHDAELVVNRPLLLPEMSYFITNGKNSMDDAHSNT